MMNDTEFQKMLESMEENGSISSFAQFIRSAMKTAAGKVCIFIDNSNLFWSLRSMSISNRLDYIKLKEILSAGRETDVRFYFSEPKQTTDPAATSRLNKQKSFYEFLEKSAGYTMVKLPLWERTVVDETRCPQCNHVDRSNPHQVAVEKGLDCEIVFDMCKLSLTSRYDTFILVAGDQDYARTVKKIREDTGISVQVAFFDGSRVSKTLVQEASEFIDLNKFKSELFSHRTSERTAV